MKIQVCASVMHAAGQVPLPKETKQPLKVIVESDPVTGRRNPPRHTQTGNMDLRTENLEKKKKTAEWLRVCIGFF